MNQRKNELVMEAEERYLHTLVNKLFKLLPTKEGEAPTFFLSYAQSLQRELIGCESMLRRVTQDPDWLSIQAVLSNLINGDIPFARFRFDVLRMISLCEKLISQHFYGEIDDDE